MTTRRQWAFVVLACLSARTALGKRDMDLDFADDFNRLDLDLNGTAEADSGPLDSEDRLAVCQASKGISEVYCKGHPECKGITTLDWPPFGHTTQKLSFAQVTAELASFPAAQRAGVIARGNDLGFCTLYEDLWAIPSGAEIARPEAKWRYRTIALGFSAEDHIKVRPVMDAVLAAGTTWTEDWIKAKIDEFFEMRTTIQTKSGTDIPVLVTKILHKLHLNMDISHEWAEEFIVFQNQFLMRAVLGSLATAVNAHLTGTDVNNRIKYLVQYMDAIENDDRGIFSDELKNSPRVEGSYKYVVASSMFDSLVFAGGLSVVSGMQTCLNVLYSNHMAEGITMAEGVLPLTQENVPAFVYETYRLMPQVWGFGWWTPEENGKTYNAMDAGGTTYTHHTLLNLATALRDGDVWDDSHTFKLRDLSQTKKAYGVVWAEQANEPNTDGTGFRNLGSMSRGCPGQDLSMALTNAFISKFISQQDEWVVGEVNPTKVADKTGGIVFIDTAPFRGKDAQFVRPQLRGMFTSTFHDGAKVEVFLENEIDSDLMRLRAYPVVQGKGARVSDDPYEGAEQWDLDWYGTPGVYKYKLHPPKQEGDEAECFTIEKVTPWGPFRGTHLKGPWSFCVAAATSDAEAKATRDKWWNALKKAIWDRSGVIHECEGCGKDGCTEMGSKVSMYDSAAKSSYDRHCK